MPAAPAHRRAALLAAALSLALVFTAFVVVDARGLGLPHFFYVPVVLVALVTGPGAGAAAGVLAAGLYCLGVIVHPGIPSAEVLTAATVIRLITFCGTGALVGWFARDHRRLVEELRILAERDSTTGLPNTRAFEAAIQRRLDADQPFALLIGDMAPFTNGEPEDLAASNDTLVRLGDLLGNLLGVEDELARVGEREFAVLTSLASSVGAARFARELEQALAANGTEIRFGWAVFPQEGQNALSLYRAADERLYARKLVGNALRSSPALRSA